MTSDRSAKKACSDRIAGDGGTFTLARFGDLPEALEEFAALMDRTADRLSRTQGISHAELFAGVLRYRAAQTRADAARAALGDAIRRHQPDPDGRDRLGPLWHAAGLPRESRPRTRREHVVQAVLRHVVQPAAGSSFQAVPGPARLTAGDNAPMPTRRCVVIGAGIMGAAVAARLATAGWQVTLLDQDQPGRATSRWSFAWLNSNDKAPRHYHDLNHAGIRAWAELAKDLDGGAWYRPAGHVELATADGTAELTARVNRLTTWGYPARLIDPPEAARLEPSLKVPASGAFFLHEGYLLTGPLIARLVAQTSSHGAEIRTGEAGRVTRLEPGAVPKVRTAAGAVLETDEVICCAGRWTPELVPVPLVPWRSRGSTAPGFVVRIGPVAPPGPARLVHTPELALRPHPGRLLHLEAPDVAVDLHTPAAELERQARELLCRAQRTVRGLDDARVVDYRVCPRPMPTDGQSIVGRLPGTPGVYVAVTHSGVTLAAHLSRLITEDLVTGSPPAPLAPYTPARFT